MTTPASGETPRVEAKFAEVVAATATVDTNTVVTEAPFAGSVSRVGYITVTAITGANTNTRTVTVTNRGSGAGSTNVATLAFTSGVNTVADTEKAVTLNSTAANLVCAAGDVITFESTHAASGLADPGGTVVVEFTRS